MLVTIWIPGLPNGFTRTITNLSQIQAIVDEWGIERVSKITVTDIMTKLQEQTLIQSLNQLD